MKGKYETLIAILFYSSSFISIIRMESINAFLWFLCAYLYLFTNDPFKNTFTKIFGTFNLLLLIVGYVVLFQQLFPTPPNTGSTNVQVFSNK